MVESKKKITEKEENYLKDNLDFVLDSLNDGLLLISLTGKILKVNKALLDMGSYSQEDLLGKNAMKLANIFPPASLKKIAGSFLDAIKGVPSDRYDLEARKKNGEVRIIEVNNSLIKKDNKTIGIVVVVRDVTERENSEKDLHQISDRLLLATKAGGVGIWDWDVVKNKLTWDDQMYKLYGIKAKDFSGAYEAWRSGLHPDDMKRGDEEIQMALKGKKEFDTEFRVLWPNKSVHYIRALATVDRDKSGKPLRMIGTNWDVTDRKKLEEVNSAKIEELEQINKLMVGRELKMVELKEKIIKLEKNKK